MPTLLIAVTAVIFAAFGVLAGVNYIDPDLKSRIQTSKALSAQYASIYSAVSSYRFENAGHPPASVADIEGYVTPEALSGYGKLDHDFSWSLSTSAPGRTSLCLTYRGGVQRDVGVVSGFARFVREAREQHPGVTLGHDCLSGEVVMGSDFVVRALETKKPYSVRFQEVY